MSDWLGIFDFMLSAANTSRSAFDVENNDSEESEKIERAVKERTYAVVEERFKTLKKKRHDVSQPKRHDRRRMKR